LLAAGQVFPGLNQIIHKSQTWHICFQIGVQTRTFINFACQLNFQRSIIYIEMLKHSKDKVQVIIDAGAIKLVIKQKCAIAMTTDVQAAALQINETV